MEKEIILRTGQENGSENYERNIRYLTVEGCFINFEYNGEVLEVVNYFKDGARLTSDDTGKIILDCDSLESLLTDSYIGETVREILSKVNDDDILSC